MKKIKYGEPLNLLIVVKGHQFDRETFCALFEEMEGVSASFIDQPAAATLLTPEAAEAFDVLVFYDMPGLDFRAPPPACPGYVDPPPAYQKALREILRAGKGVVALHHAIAAWPTWDEYAEWLGGRFLYRPGMVRDVASQDSGYRYDVDYEAVAVAPDHPILAGLPQRFPMRDELYLFEIFEDAVTPLLRADYAFARDNFYSCERAVAHGRKLDNANWEHAPGSNLIAWAKPALNSPLVYLQPGDGPAAHGDRVYRKLVENAVRWAASPAAHAWARGAK